MSDLPLLRDKVIAIVKDNSGKLVNPDDYDSGIAAAVLKFSKDKPFAIIEDIAGDGTDKCLLPAAWSPEFSLVVSIEFPIGQFPPALFEEGEDFYVIPRSGTLQMRDVKSTAEILRVTFTAVRTADDIPDVDIAAVANLAAGFCLEALANAFLQLGDPTIGADAVNYHSKSAETASRAKRLMQLYKDHLGIKEGDSDTMPASAVADYDEKYPGGSERLTHPRWARKRR
jgi:hypothetical protein